MPDNGQCVCGQVPFFHSSSVTIEFW